MLALTSFINVLFALMDEEPFKVDILGLFPAVIKYSTHHKVSHFTKFDLTKKSKWYLHSEKLKKLECNHIVLDGQEL